MKKYHTTDSIPFTIQHLRARVSPHPTCHDQTDRRPPPCARGNGAGAAARAAAGRRGMRMDLGGLCAASVVLRPGPVLRRACWCCCSSTEVRTVDARPRSELHDTHYTVHSRHSSDETVLCLCTALSLPANAERAEDNNKRKPAYV